MALALLKLGGAVITDKRASPPKARLDVLQRLAQEIHDHWDGSPLIIVHGAGCFGHIPAKQYDLTAAQWHEKKRLGTVIIREYMHELNGLVVHSLVQAKLPAMAFQPGAAAAMDQKKLQHFNLDILQHWLHHGIIPVLYGDVAVDASTGIDILSGDQIIAYLANALKPELVILGTDVDGVFDCDPKQHANARMIAKITSHNLHEVLQGLGGSQYVDVTGGMAQKVQELMGIAQTGVPIQIINATVPDRLGLSLGRENVVGTWIQSC